LNSREVHLQGTGSGKQSRELGLPVLQVRVTANVLLANVDVGDSALAGDFLESGLNSGAVLYLEEMLVIVESDKVFRDGMVGRNDDRAG
jgi:hypothetical protein